MKGKDKKVIGEASTSYTYNSSFSAPSIAKHLPDAKLIYITRDPLMRMESHWMHLCRKINQRDLHLRIWSFNLRIIQDPAYIEYSKYWKQISAYRKYFRDDQILVLFLKDLVAQQEATIEKCFEFLGLEPKVLIHNSIEYQNKSVGRYFPGKLQQYLSRVKPLYRITKKLPETLTKPLARRLSRKIDARPTWDPEVRQWAIDHLADDTQQFLELYGKPPDWWQC
ncbi:MAG: sulfotransferase [Hormoscilla sp. GM7CHS1pb]|nr:sulfotransferase [Hormoscilla sp. GM7CHS1pb]